MGVLKDQARANGYDMLRDDEMFIRRVTENVPYNARRAALRGYFNAWSIGMAEAEIKAHRQNAGRRAANLYLMKTLKVKEDVKKLDPS